MVMDVVHEDMQCTDHPYMNNSSPGGICAFCLQEKLGNLVSSSSTSSVAVFPTTSSSISSSSPSFRSDYPASSSANSLTISYTNTPSNNSKGCSSYTRSSSILVPFMLAHKKKKNKNSKKNGTTTMLNSAADSNPATGIVFKRSKSVTTPRRGNVHFLDENNSNGEHHRRGFWSFLYSSKHHSSAEKRQHHKDLSLSSAVASSYSVNGVGTNDNRSRDNKMRTKQEIVGVDENGSTQNEAAFDQRKVSRSRSVGCGSRSFSGDFFERISTGFGDCALRRVESQREGKPKMPTMHHRNGCGKERVVRCGGIFTGFMANASSSSSYLVSNEDSDASRARAERFASHGRSRSWGFLALASPMRAFSSKPSSGKRDSSANSNKNAAPDLNAIPSLLAVSS